eukprot:gnl/MRDRNA2_/MRDRNA2_29492_c0_seq1.p1 gnl/MRDRNA2_/MRDRNA2_29492_c0~~gnl/MRDRNA2_/MRDRNA2_29492_c0_seq1.p1  ORF type:complete len:172 (+),score=39.60 gnl/MRDRNA2_/MRDRNA2_29492_c0_seq1:81-596(+)
MYAQEFPQYPNGMRFKATVIAQWYPPYNMVGAVGADPGESVVIFDDDEDNDYEDPNSDGWALIRKIEDNTVGYFPEAFLDVAKAIPESKWQKPQPGQPGGPSKPGKPTKNTTNHPDGKPAKAAKAGKPSGGGLGICGPKKAGKAGKRRAIELLDENGGEDDDDDDDDCDMD